MTPFYMGVLEYLTEAMDLNRSEVILRSLDYMVRHHPASSLSGLREYIEQKVLPNTNDPEISLRIKQDLAKILYSGPSIEDHAVQSLDSEVDFPPYETVTTGIDSGRDMGSDLDPKFHHRIDSADAFKE